MHFYCFKPLTKRLFRKYFLNICLLSGDRHVSKCQDIVCIIVIFSQILMLDFNKKTYETLKFFCSVWFNITV